MLRGEFVQSAHSAAAKEPVEMAKVIELISKHPAGITLSAPPLAKTIGDASKDRERQIFFERSWQKLTKHRIPFVVFLERKSRRRSMKQAEM
jgi:hypothetical protein